MSRTTPSPQPQPPSGGGRHDDRHALAAGGTVFAGILLIVSGVLAVLEGIVGIARDSVLVVSQGGYAYHFNLRAWGWIHLVIGVLAVLVGWSLLQAAAWARYAGIAIASFSMVANFMFLPYQPIWSLILIAIDVFVIWALATFHPRHERHRGDRS